MVFGWHQHLQRIILRTTQESFQEKQSLELTRLSAIPTGLFGDSEGVHTVIGRSSVFLYEPIVRYDWTRPRALSSRLSSAYIPSSVLP